MDSIRLQNYRCFEDTGVINIKPLTFLLGANSSGKSSFLKFLPLLKQSVGVGIKGSFLWNSDDVDFNNFNNTVKDGCEEIVVTMQMDNLQLVKRYNILKQSFSNIKIEMHLRALDADFDYLSKLIISYDSVKIEIIYNDYYTIESLSVNDLILDGEENQNLKLKSSTTNSLLPKVQFVDNNNYYGDDPDIVEKLFYKIINIPQSDSLYYRRILLASYRKIISYDNLLNYIGESLSSKLSDETIRRTANIAILYNINNIIDSLNLYYLSFSSSISYVQPIRVHSQRYYRFQNFAAQDIDPDGRNLPMFFNSLSEELMDDLNKWLEKIFGFKLSISRTGGSLEILIEEEGKKPRNMVDVGFGYTQCLPILTLIWKVTVLDCINGLNSDREQFCNEHIIAIEQPELHLHPRFQALFAEMVAKAVVLCNEKNKDIRFVIETHSEAIISKIGELVADGSVSKDYANVVIFNANHEGLPGYVEQVEFTSEGFITNWPYGFFSYVDRSKR